MGWIEQFRREAYATLIGLREAIANTAERAAQERDYARLHLASRSVDRALETQLATLGRRVFRLRDQARLVPDHDPALLRLVSRVRALGSEQKALARRLLDVREGLSREHFLRVIDQLQRDRGTLAWTTHAGPPQPLHAIGLSRKIRVICVERRGQLLIPSGDTVLERSDRLLLLGRIPELHEALEQV